jgi:UDP-N-acetylmuramyl tripeptide synthase
VPLRLAVAAGRAARWAARLRGGGSAVPGVVALRLEPRFLERTIADLPHGVVAVTGSNGKSTTTHMLTAVLRAHGLRVFTNPSGGNLPQGIASAVLADADASGRLDADVAVLEIDEAYGVALSALLTPRTVLLLNIQIDQLNRFHEPDRVVGMLERIAATATEAVVANRDDANVNAIAAHATSTGRAAVDWFGVSPALLDDSKHGLASAPRYGSEEPAPVEAPAAVEAVALEGRDAVFRLASGDLTASLPSRGLHYAVDAAGALATARRVLGDRFDPALAAQGLGSVAAVYGRGEVLRAGDEDIEIIMMKNPASLQMNLDALGDPPEQVLLAVDDGTPDPSWIYDTDLSALTHADVVSGTKGYQLAVRFGYEGLEVGRVEPDLRRAVQAFLAMGKPSRGVKTMIVNYEQMMAIRRILGYTDLEGGPA